MQQYKPTTPARRGMTRPDFSILTKSKPEKNLLTPLKKTGGRSHGKITSRFRGGGAKRRYRILDFGRGQDKRAGKATVEAIEYDPNRSARIALLKYPSGNKSYMIAPQGISVGEELEFSAKASLKTGNRAKLKNISVGSFLYNIEIIPGTGGKIARSAGCSCKLLALEGKYATLSMPSGEMRKILSECYASIGEASNPQHGLETIGSAGRNRHKGRRPHVRGSAMNPVDHPHGGGEGRTSIGLKYPKTKWGKIAIGGKTRKRKKYSDKLILQRRKNKKRK